MSFRSNAFRVFASFLVIAALGVVTLADTIRLKDGSKVKGKIVGFAGGKFTISMGGGARKRQMTFSADEIESIEFDQSPGTGTSTQAIVIRSGDPEPAAAKPQPKTEAPISKKTETPTDVAAIEEEADDEPVAQPAKTTANPPPTATRKVSYGKPVELNVKVLADNTANGWTNSGWIVKKGQRIRISGSGQVSIGRGKSTGPSGLYDLEDGDKLLKSVPTGALIAVIGDDNNEFIYVGAEREFTATRDGALFLGLNEGNLNDNTGAFDVKVEITPQGDGE